MKGTPDSLIFSASWNDEIFLEGFCYLSSSQQSNFVK